jgi:hypothetical protein
LIGLELTQLLEPYTTACLPDPSQNQDVKEINLKFLSFKQIVLDRVIAAQMDKKLSNCYGTWRYVTVLTRIHHWILS